MLPCGYRRGSQSGAAADGLPDVGADELRVYPVQTRPAQRASDLNFATARRQVCDGSTASLRRLDAGLTGEPGRGLLGSTFEHVFEAEGRGPLHTDHRCPRPRKVVAMRQYGDPIEVRRGLVTGLDAPEQFVWRGKLWVVREIIAHWVRTGAWWEQEAATDLLAEREVWRVEAGRGRTVGTAGVFDLAFDWGDGCWLLVCSID
jgi:hypothetical protein